MIWNIAAVAFFIGAVLIFIGASTEDAQAMPVLALLFWPYVVIGLVFLLLLHIVLRKREED